MIIEDGATSGGSTAPIQRCNSCGKPQTECACTQDDPGVSELSQAPDVISGFEILEVVSDIAEGVFEAIGSIFD